MKKKKHFNPFYFVLVIVGVAFCLTAFSFGIMSLREMQSGRDWTMVDNTQTESELNFMEFMNRHGVKIMIWELAILSVATIGAIATDDYWGREPKSDQQ